jgi:hypothetical protein
MLNDLTTIRDVKRNKLSEVKKKKVDVKAVPLKGDLITNVL